MIGAFLVTQASSQVIIALLFGEKLNKGQMEFGLMLSPTFCNITNIESETRTAFGLSLYLTFKQSENLFFKVEASPKAVFGAQGIPAYATAIEKDLGGRSRRSEVGSRRSEVGGRKSEVRSRRIFFGPGSYVRG